MYALPVPDYENQPRYRPLLKAIDDRVRAEALAAFLPAFNQHYQRHLASPRVDYDVRIGEGDPLLRRLQEDGCAVTAVHADSKQRLLSLTLPMAQQVEARVEARVAHGAEARFKDMQLRLDRTQHADIYQALDEIFANQEIYAAGSAYSGKPLSLKAAAIQVNTAAATAISYQRIDEAGLPEPKTRYFHIDSALWPPLKVLIYLNTVTLDEGPFRYVAGSHRLAGDFELMVRKTNDAANIHDVRFLALPEPFRLYTSFGEAMDPHGEAAQALLRNELVYDDGVSDLILFDFNGVHRGGFVRRGRRYMLQCTFEAKA